MNKHVIIFLVIFLSTIIYVNEAQTYTIPTQTGNFTFETNNQYTGEFATYKILLKLPKGATVGYIGIGAIKDGYTDFSSATLEVTGLEYGEATLRQQMGVFGGHVYKYSVKPSITLEKDTEIEFLIVGAINPQYPDPYTYNQSGYKKNPIIGVQGVIVCHEDYDCGSSVIMSKTSESVQLKRRPFERSTVFSHNGAFETSNKYFDNYANYKISFNLPKGLNVGRVNIDFDNDYVDFSNAKLTVNGLPSGQAYINYQPGVTDNFDLSYKLDSVIGLSEDTAVMFYVENAKNPSLNSSPYGTRIIGYDRVEVSDSVDKDGNSALFDYNEYNQIVGLPEHMHTFLENEPIEKPAEYEYVEEAANTNEASETMEPPSVSTPTEINNETDLPNSEAGKISGNGPDTNLMNKEKPLLIDEPELIIKTDDNKSEVIVEDDYTESLSNTGQSVIENINDGDDTIVKEEVKESDTENTESETEYLKDEKKGEILTQNFKKLTISVKKIIINILQNFFNLFSRQRT